MIVNSFDINTPSKINPKYKVDRIKCDACIVTFSNIIEEYVLKKYNPEVIGNITMVNGIIPVYKIEVNGKIFAFYKTIMTAAASAGCLEDSTEIINTDKYIVFGGSGCLNKDIARGKIMIPTEAYRDEGLSYHYAEASDYITIKHSKEVASFMESKNLPYVLGKTWTTDSFYRETEGNLEKRKSEGCISVEMECSAFEAVCDYRNINLYYFLSSGDLLDSPEWDSRITDPNNYTGTQHDYRLFDIAIELADYVSKKTNEYTDSLDNHRKI